MLKVIMMALVWRFAIATVSDANNADAKFRQYWTDRFTTFTQEQNVPGKAKRPDGKVVPGGKKVRWDKDDGFQYEGYLTYHDFSYDVDEQVKKVFATKPEDKETQTLYSHISRHGGLSEAGGSSLLERTVYEQHKKFMQEQKEALKNAKPLDEDKTGTKNQSVFQVDTREVFRDEFGKETTENDPKLSEVDKIEKWKLRSEVKKEVEKVGEEAFSTFERAARDKGYESDDKTLANSTLLSEAAIRSYNAWSQVAESNVKQAQVAREARGRIAGASLKVELDEDVPTCESWAAQVRAKLTASGAGDDKDQKEIDRMVSECKAIAKTSIDQINPTFDMDPNDPDGKAILKIAGPKRERARERDQRLQVELLKDPQKKASEIESNWDYNEEDLKAEVAVGLEDDGITPIVKEMTGAEQVESYNQQLKSAAKGIEEVKKRFPEYDVTSKQVLQYQIKGRPSAKEIARQPKEIYEDDSGVSPPLEELPPKNYDEMVSKP